jgi:hypothetical protein
MSYWYTLETSMSGRRYPTEAPWDARGSRGMGSGKEQRGTPYQCMVRGAEMRIAETRAVNRALRKAYVIALCSVNVHYVHDRHPLPSHEGRCSDSDRQNPSDDWFT